MRWIQYRTATGDRAGLEHDGAVLLTAEPTTTRELLLRGDAALTEVANQTLAAPGEQVAVEPERYAPPVEPASIRDFLCFLDHLRNCRGGAELEPVWDEIPAFYFSNPAAVVGPYDPVEISPGSTMFDFELEVGAVIGRTGRHLHPDEADGYIAGFTILCDWSARDVQVHEMAATLGPAKGKDGATTLGPALITRDELEPYRSGLSYDLEMRAFVNGELIGRGNLNQMDWSFGETIAYASRGTAVRVGDVIGSGTVPTGCLAEHYATAPQTFRGWLQPGDRVRLEVDVLGHVEHTVVAGVAPHQVRGSRPQVIQA